MDLEWDSVRLATSYRVAFSDDGGLGWTFVGRTSNTSITVTGVPGVPIEASTAYTFSVQAGHPPDIDFGTAATTTHTTPACNDQSSFPSSEGGTRSVPENTAAGKDIGNAVAATDDDGDPLAYTLGGDDAASFTIVGSSGQLRTDAALDYEDKNTYSVTVSVRDNKDDDGDPDTAVDATIGVTINVTNVDEPGVVRLSDSSPAVGTEVTATLESDPDGIVSGTAMWQWQRKDSGVWVAIGSATADAYTPISGDAGKEIRAAVVYTDGFGAGRLAYSPAATVGSVTPEITIARHSDTPESITEGQEAKFTLTATRVPSPGLTVGVTVAQQGGYLASTLPSNCKAAQPPLFVVCNVSISSVTRTGSLNLPTTGNDLDEVHGSITVTIQASMGDYSISGPPSATVTVEDDEMPGTPTNVGANGKVEYAFSVWDDLNYDDRTDPITPNDLESYTPTVLPKVWWAPSANTRRYQVLVNREQCGYSANDLVPGNCRMVDPDNPTIVEETSGGANIQASPASIPEDDYELGLLYAIRVRAVDINGNMSEPSEPVYVLPYHQRPEAIQLDGRRAYFQVATASLFGYLQATRHIGGKIPYLFVVCDNTFPSTVNDARTTREIDGAIKTWHAVEQSFRKPLFNLMRVGRVSGRHCSSGDNPTRIAHVEEVRFANARDWDLFLCYPEADGCYRNWAHWRADFTTSQVEGYAELTNMNNPGRIMLREEPVDASYWSSTAGTFQSDCTALEHIVAHEFIHSLGVGFPIFSMLRLSHPYLQTNSLGSTMFDGHTNYCEPYPHDIVAIMAIHQQFDSELTIRDNSVQTN